MIDRTLLVEKLNSLCWQARRWGHADYGMDYGVDINGNEKSADVDDDDDFSYHPEAVALADELLRLLS